MVTQNGEQKHGLVIFRTNQGVETRGSVLRLSHHATVFELYHPETLIRSSEVLDGFQVYVNDQAVYSGRAVVQSTTNTGSVTVCSALLDDLSFNADFFASLARPGFLEDRFHDFIHQWQDMCRVLPEFKVAISDIQTFLIDARKWLEQIELGIRSSPKLGTAQHEHRVIDELHPLIVPVIDALFEKFENIASRLEPDLVPVHRSYIQRHLHPIVLCAPFAYRTYRKPLGYAGDYEMVNMMLRDPREGSSLFAKLFNVWLLSQNSAAAHRNRVAVLKQRLIEETATARLANRQVRILNLGCGPAGEVQQFLAETDLSNSASFTLMDFNDETLQYTSQVVQQLRQRHHRSTPVKFVKKSVQQLLKDTVRMTRLVSGSEYDFIYCAGLFDYLPDRTCERLMTLFYHSLAPGGLLLSTNVAPFSPNRGSLELILDWHLIYRNAAEMLQIRPEGLAVDQVRAYSDETSVNVFLETRKSDAV